MLCQQRDKVCGCIPPLHKHLTEIAEIDVVVRHTVGANITKKVTNARLWLFYSKTTDGVSAADCKRSKYRTVEP